ncbi:MAG TPA: hypothetical protein VJ010_06515 [Actinomycetota bacterium]|nr:hypothetical protein [Actinomycetota bacterium]
MYNQRPGTFWRSAIALAIAAVLTAGGALPAQAHTTGPQLISHIDGIAPAAPGVDYSLLSTGSAPYVTVSLRGAHTFEIRGLQGEPFIQITQDGVSVNRDSPSRYLTRDPSKKPAIPPTVSQTPAWEKVADQPLYHYYETRAEWPHVGQPDEARRLGRTATVYRFSIPAVFDGHPAAIEGHVTWIPAPINLEIPLLFVPLVVVGLLWLEPKAKPHAAKIARGVTALALIAAAVEAARILVDLRSGTAGVAGLAPLAVLPGLVLVTTVALPRLLRAERRAYTWVLLFGLYLLVFGLLRTVAPASSLTLGTWLRRAEMLAGFGVSAGAGLLLFLSSPIRIASPPAHISGPKRRRVATD